MTRREKFIILILAIILIALALWADRCHAQPSGHHLRTNMVVVSEPCQYFNYWAIRTDGGMTHLISIVDHISGEFEHDLKVLPSNYLAVIKIERSGGVTCIWHASTTLRAPAAVASPPMPPMPRMQPALSTTHFGPPAPICTPASFSWACVSPINAVLDPVTKWDCYSQLNLDFIAESNKCYQVEWSEGATFSDGSLVWHPITTICPRPFTGYNFVAVPIQNCTWVDQLIYPMPTNLLVTTYGTMYRLNSHY